MAFPTIVGTAAESATTTAGTSHVVNLPAGASGNLFLLFMSKGPVNTTINALAGWTELVDEAVSSGAFCAYRVCDGTEGTTTTFTSASSVKTATIVYEINGQAVGLAPEISAVASASTDAPNPNTCTPTGGAKDYLWFTWFVMGAASEEADDDTWVNNAATNYGSLLQKTSSTAGVNVGAAVATCHRTNNASSEDAAWPAGSTDQTIVWRSFTVAVHPLRFADPGPMSFLETGVLADLRVGRALAGGAVPGSYSLTGVAATLVKAAAGISMNADPGAYTETGVAADLKVGRALAGGAVPGAYTETGVAASLLAARLLSGGAAPGSVVETGVPATLVADRLLAGGALPGSFSFGGVAATLVVDHSITASPGAYTLTGVAASLVYTPLGGGGDEPYADMFRGSQTRMQGYLHLS